MINLDKNQHFFIKDNFNEQLIFPMKFSRDVSSSKCNRIMNSISFIFGFKPRENPISLAKQHYESKLKKYKATDENILTVSAKGSEEIELE